MRKGLQHGFTLAEIVLSAFVLALGIVGAAAMQLTALRTIRQSAFHSAALDLATELADQIRASRLSAGSGHVHPYIGMDYRTTTEPIAPSILCYGPTVSCDPQQFAQFEFYDWQRRMRFALPAARAVVCHDAAPWDATAGVLRWACSSTGNAAGSLVIKIGWQTGNPDGSRGHVQQHEFPPLLALTVSPGFP
jgi:type IV pilus assembly protein PilV